MPSLLLMTVARQEQHVFSSISLQKSFLDFTDIAEYAGRLRLSGKTTSPF